jgi:hypothetical protein
MQQGPQREMKFTQLLKIFPATYKTQSFVQELTMCSSPDPNDSSPQSSTLFFLMIHANIILLFINRGGGVM